MGLLGEARGSLLVGSVATPLGELSVSCTYRRLLGFGRPSNTPTYQSRPIKSRTDSGGHLPARSPVNIPSGRSPVNIPMRNPSLRNRPSSGGLVGSLGSECSSAPPPLQFYSGSPGSYTPGTPYAIKHSQKDASPGFRRPNSQTRLVRTGSTSSNSPCELKIMSLRV